jgi:hypothetical protein
MIAIIIGLIFIALGVWAVLPLEFPLGLNWLPQVIAVIQGGAPIIAVLLGLLAVLVGIADIKDAMAAKKEAEEASKESK